ncbi:DUF2164 domain-containing protein [Phenylobacterium sp.]|uniref:DUF2164 domain-containing protein n=1 Tax=Phenylobacterium sp. TaxID=1871053 RepID=UPI0008B33053|nr:DUF2164 domain-containing protein [Phenylobacterium sp.]MBA4792863.1 DUF2164 domain-containing protein [Phenylobacterium sp.]MBC7166497.1 DUF2164 domain-containing protein [Phenylobacterium sp.]OHB35413.1 MAG: hypothetical protein A2882_02580 [Phenylobacterium sp. RIFCSPHIGHO2_01_FULL_70_10]
MSKIEFSKEAREALAEALSRYLKDELDLEVKGFDAVFLLDFISETLGPHFYNQGLWDAQAALQKKLDLISQAIDELEKPAKL